MTGEEAWAKTHPFQPPLALHQPFRKRVAAENDLPIPQGSSGQAPHLDLVEGSWRHHIYHRWRKKSVSVFDDFPGKVSPGKVSPGKFSPGKISEKSDAFVRSNEP